MNPDAALIGLLSMVVSTAKLAMRVRLPDKVRAIRVRAIGFATLLNAASSRAHRMAASAAMLNLIVCLVDARLARQSVQRGGGHSGTQSHLALRARPRVRRR